MGGEYGHRREGDGRDFTVRGFYCHAGEKDVADNLVIPFGDLSDEDDSFFAKVVDEIGFVGASEGRFVYGANPIVIAGLLFSDVEGQSYCTGRAAVSLETRPSKMASTFLRYW
jgi:hypothetical protein